MNARNLQYIKKFNPKKSIRLADNKFKTKRFLSERGIPVPYTYDLIKSRDALYAYDFSSLPVDDFIVKPVRWSRGRWIYRVKLAHKPKHVSYLSKLWFFEKYVTPPSLYPEQWYKVSWEYVQDSAFRRYLLDILDGKNSLSTRWDVIMLEEVLKPWAWFERYCDYGLADIRVIVFNLIPVAAMLRVPTKASDGKANLDRWALGMWVEVWSGKVYAMYKEGTIYTKDFPEPYESFAHQHLPYRDDVLKYSSKIQYLANLWYLALDWVITEQWPKLLEINARAWLKFQNASLLPLRKRLNRIKDIHISTPEKGVEIAQTLFSRHKAHVVTASKILYLRQEGKCIFTDAWVRHEYDVDVFVDMHKKHSYMSPFLYWVYTENKERNCTLVIGTDGIRFDTIKWKQGEGEEKFKVVLWQDAVANYFIKPLEQVQIVTDFISPKHLQKWELDHLHVLDKKLGKIWRMLNISRILKPVNYLDQLDNFITWGGAYTPTFTYMWPSDKRLQGIQDDLDRLQEEYFGANPVQSSFAHLFEEKLQELYVKLDLIQAYKYQDYTTIKEANTRMYGPLSDACMQEAKHIVFSHEHDQESYDLWRVLSWWEIKHRVQQYLRDKWLDEVRIQYDQSNLARMSVSKWSSIVIKISPQARFYERELEGTLAHEIDVHVRRYIAGMQSWWDILKSGTAWYLSEEEWLAVWFGQQRMPAWYLSKRVYYRYLFLEQWMTKDFQELAWIIRGLKWLSLADAFNDALRMKKWLIDTWKSSIGVLYTKDKVYQDGLQKVVSWIEQWGDIESLMIWKIKIDDLKYIV